MKYLIIFFVFICKYSSAQKNYFFDHQLEYEYFKDSEAYPEMRYVFTNSSAANYYILLKPGEEVDEVIFLDYNGYTSSFKLKSEEFFDNHKINLDCEIVYKLYNPLKRKIREYHITQERDTILKKESHKVFVLKNQKESKEKRQNLVRHFYVLGNNTGYHKQVPLFHLAYEENKKENSLPAGIFTLMYNVNYNGDTTEIYRLTNVVKVNKNFSFKEDCENLK